MITEQPSSIDVDPTTPKHRRQVVAIGVAVALLVAGLGGFLLYRSANGDVLSAKGNTWGFPDERMEDPFHHRELRTVAYQHDGPYTYSFTLDNRSRWPVKVLGLPGSDGGLLEQGAIEMDRTPFAGGAFTFEAFRPFTLKAHGSALIQVHNRFAHCKGWGRGGAATLVAQSVRYRALWLTRTRFLDLPIGVQMRSPEDCPE